MDLIQILTDEDEEIVITCVDCREETRFPAWAPNSGITHDQWGAWCLANVTKNHVCDPEPESA